MIGTFAFVGYLGFGIALVLAILCPVVARHQQRRLLPVHSCRPLTPQIRFPKKEAGTFFSAVFKRK